MVKDLLLKRVLLGPAPLRKAAATRVVLPQEEWMLHQPREVRRSYAAEVLDAEGDPDVLAEIWMLRQSDEVRRSYIEEVLQPALTAVRER